MLFMRFMFDARYIRTDFHDGVSRYSCELAAALFDSFPDTIFLISNNRQLEFLPKNANSITIHSVKSWREPFTSLILNKYHPDVVATPLQTMGCLGKKFKLILNQQDMTYYKQNVAPSYLPLYLKLLWWIYHLSYIPGRLVLNSADMVATVSEASKKEILDAKLTKRKVIVVPNAARDLSIHRTSRNKKLNSQPKNLVYMGSFLPHKNVETLVKMMNFLPDRTLHLLSSIEDSRKKELLRINKNNVVFHNGVSDQKYVELLSSNAIMVSASFSEGYGLPLAEALNLGTPAVVSNLSVFREVAGPGALYADPNSPKDFSKKICSLDDQTLRYNLTDAGSKHVKKFSWQHSAKTLLENAEKLAKSD